MKTIILGSVTDAEAWEQIPDGSVQCVITSPPYWALRDYGIEGQLGSEPTPEEFCANLVKVFRFVWRKLRDDGLLFLNLGEKFEDKHLLMIPAKVVIALQADGWVLRDFICWHKPSPMPGSQTDRCTMSWEPVFMLAKRERYFSDMEAVKEAGGGNEESQKRAAYGRYEVKVSGARRNHKDGKPDYLQREGNDYGGAFRNLRNVWTIASEPSCYEFCAACGGLFVGSARKAIKRKQVGGNTDVASSTLGGSKRNCHDALEKTGVSAVRTISTCPTCLATDAWVAHYAAFPTELVLRCLKIGTSPKGACAACGTPWVRMLQETREHGLAANPYPKAESLDAGHGHKRLQQRVKAARSAGEAHDNPLGGKRTTGWRPGCECGAETRPCIALDPFMGSGTTAIAAEQLGLDWCGLELNPEYRQMALARIAHARNPTSYATADAPRKGLFG